MTYKAWENGGVPPRWLNCPRKGQPMEHFLPFKTPLSSRYDKFVPPANRFSVQMLFQSVASLNRRILMWIDLTKTDRFYSPKDVTDQGARYVKMKLAGHDEAPTDVQCQRFFQVVNEFMTMANHFHAQQPQLFPTVAVHCTHGFNRTGFLICAYYVTHYSWDVPVALRAFAEARPPGIYKMDYISELYRRYNNEEIPDDFPAVELPRWCFDEQDHAAVEQAGTSQGSPKKRGAHEATSSGDEEDDEDDSSKKVRTGDDESDTLKVSRPQMPNTKKATFIKPDAKFLDGRVRNVNLVSDYDEITRVQLRVQQICGREVGSTGGTSGFPGGQPVSLTFDNLHLLSRQRYKVSWKADGLRYMMFIEGRGQVYMIDRDNTVFHVPNLLFPFRKDHSKHLENTLIDGEMVIDKVNDQEIPRYLMYDIVLFGGQEVGKLPFDRRTSCIQLEIIDTRAAAMQSGEIDKANEPFSIRIKQFYDLAHARTLLEDSFAKQLTHKMDGLILQPFSEAYHSGTWHSLLKWKPPTENSVDFRLQICTKRAEGSLPEKHGLLYVNGYPSPIAEIQLTRELMACDDKIVECFFDFVKGQWQFMRVRTDKSHPNAFSVVQNILGGIQKPVTDKILLDYIASLAATNDAANQRNRAEPGRSDAKK